MSLLSLNQFCLDVTNPRNGCPDFSKFPPDINSFLKTFTDKNHSSSLTKPTPYSTWASTMTSNASSNTSRLIPNDKPSYSAPPSPPKSRTLLELPCPRSTNSSTASKTPTQTPTPTSHNTTPSYPQAPTSSRTSCGSSHTTSSSPRKKAKNPKSSSSSTPPRWCSSLLSC